jgi:hypothetical protein
MPRDHPCDVCALATRLANSALDKTAQSTKKRATLAEKSEDKGTTSA